MTIQYDVKSAHTSTSASLFGGPARVKGFSICATASTAGTLQLKDGGSGGTVLIEIDIPSNSNPNSFYVAIPSDGVKFNTSVYAALTNIASVTVFYG